MKDPEITVVLAHGAWADGSSWAKVITELRSNGAKAVATPLPLTTLRDGPGDVVVRTILGRSWSCERRREHPFLRVRNL